MDTCERDEDIYPMKDTHQSPILAYKLHSFQYYNNLWDKDTPCNEQEVSPSGVH